MDPVPTPGDDLRTGPSVRRVALGDDTVAGIAALAGALGLRVIDVDLAGCRDKGDLLDSTSKALAFPRWFGGNWDAWFDCLTDLNWQPPAAGYVLLLRHALRLRQTAPEALDTALSILDDAARVWATRGVTFRAFVDLEST